MHKEHRYNVKKAGKSVNFKEMNQANQRRLNKYEREAMKVQNKYEMEQAYKLRRLDEIEWAVTDKDDKKFQKKMEAKKGGKNGWGKKKWFEL